MSTGKVITGLVAGMAAGALLGILFAPDKGTETRRKISKKGSDLKNSFKDKFSSMVDEVVDEFENAKGKAGEIIEHGKDRVSALKADAKHALS